jgi:hypothetical protein
MKARMTKEDARAWKERWRLVNEFEIHETRTTPLLTKYRQFLELLHWGRALGWTEKLGEGEEEVRQRWRRLREIYRAKEKAAQTAP